MGIAPVIGGRGGASSLELAAVARGLVAETFPVAGLAGSSATPGTTTATSTIAGTLIGLRAGTKISNLVRFCVSAGASVTLSKLALYDKTGKLLAATSDGHASLAANGYHVVPIAKDGAGATITSYTVLTDDGYFIAGLDLASAGTAPSFLRGNTLTGLSAAVGSGAMACMLVATQSDLNANVTPAAASNALWFAAS